MKRFLSFLILSLLYLFSPAMADNDFQEVWIYPEENYPETNGHENDSPTTKDNWTARPYMHIYLADSLYNSGRTVVCLPGGGYSHLSLTNEGSAWAPFFRKLGINFVVLAYRMPYGHDGIPQNDVYDGIRYLKAHATELGVDTEDIGIMGFSAGGHLATTVATHAPDDVRPAFQILFYPVVSMDTTITHRGSRDNLLGKNPTASKVNLYSNEKCVSTLTPPAILLLADDDRAVPSPNAVGYYLAMRKYNRPAALHIYPSGGHGFGFRESFLYHDAMLKDLTDWLTIGLPGSFSLGADISWTTKMESNGDKFYDFDGRPREAFALCKEMGMNAVRLRVWVDPKDEKDGQPWCDKNDLLAKALRAKKQGLDVMVDFHYSDNWADPAKQDIPAQWVKHDLNTLCQDVANHTREVLSLLKENDVWPRWVQVGNETSNGFLWPTGQVYKNAKGYAMLFNAGYAATKEIFPDAKVIVHLDNGWDQTLYDFNLGILRDYGAKWDLIGMSIYPYWTAKNDWTHTADWTIDHAIANIRHLAEAFGTDVIVTETGYEVDEAYAEVCHQGYEQFTKLLRRCRFETGGHCRGVFYWEPLCRPSMYKLGAFTEDGHPTEIMRAYKDYTK